MVDAPQMKKLPVSSQKVREWRAPSSGPGRRRGTGCRRARRIGDVVRRRKQSDVLGPVAHQERDERQDDAERDDGDVTAA